MTAVAEWVGLDAARVWHPYTQHHDAPPARPIVRAEGAYLIDGDGRRILDAISSWWVTTHGHAHPAIADAIATQARCLEQVIFAGFTHEPASRLAAELLPRLPGAPSRLFFTDDGSTAVEVALKMALQFWRNRGEARPIIAALEHAYHGDTLGAMSVSARSVFTEPFDPQMFDVARLPDPERDDPVAALSDLVDRARGRIAALIVEPLLLGAGGMRVYPADVLARLATVARDAGVLLIADEVLTGFGRTGPLFACSRAGIEPDITCLSKGLSGGALPLGATAVRGEVFDAFLGSDRRRTLFHGHSYTANPIACAAARASLALFDAAGDARRAAIEDVHRAHLERLAAHPAVRAPRTIGTVAAFDLVSESRGYLAPIGRELAAFALEHDVLLRPLGNVVYVLPPYCVTDAELETVYDVIARFMDSRC